MSGLSQLAVYRLLRRQRLRKVVALYRRALSFVFDLTFLLYAVPTAFLMGSYVRARILHTVDLSLIQELTPYPVAVALSVLMLLSAVFASLAGPRYRFTNSDALLHQLPLDVERYARYVIVRQQGVRAALFTLAALLLAGTTLLRWETAGLALFAVLLADAAGGLLQWTLFQFRFGKRVLYAVAAIAVIFALLLLAAWFGDSAKTLAMFFATVLGSTVLFDRLWRRPLTKQADWARTIHAGEQKTWQSPLVKYIVRDGNAADPEDGSNFNRPALPTLPTHPDDRGRARAAARSELRRKAKPAPYDLDHLLRSYWRTHLLKHRRSLLAQLVFHLFILHIVIYTSGAPYPGLLALASGVLVCLYVARLLILEAHHNPRLAALPLRRKRLTRSFAGAAWWWLFVLAVPAVIQVIL